MKPGTVTVLLAAAFILHSSGTGGDMKERYGFKQAKIVVEKRIRNASLESTTIDTVCVDDWGWVEVRHSYEKKDIRMINKTTESRTVSIMEREWLTSYDPVKRKGTKIRNPFYHSAGNLSEQQQKGMAEGTTKAFKVTTSPRGTEEIAGRLCEITETRTGLDGMESVTTAWMWKGYVMKSVTTAAGSEITELVLSFDEGTGVSPSLLRIPDDIQITTPPAR